tara:strand:- start:2096 stop:2962 length:867 start_codon:yes stop_codon:yes gene_type:complete
MDNIDLDIDNYGVEDILNIFKLDYNFDKSDLKNAKQIALKTHPDKSNLGQEVYHFFMKAYGMVEQIYSFRNKKKQSTEYYTEDLEGNKELLKVFDGMKVSKFNEVFNEMFDKVKVHDEEDESGYGDWFKSDNDINNVKVNNLSEFDNAFEKRKKECHDLIIHRGIQEMTQGGGGSNILREKQDLYSSDIFSKLPYDDLRRAHTETVVPVTREDFENKQKFNNVEEYVKHRNNMDTSSMSLEQSKMLLKNRNLENDKHDTNRAFKIIKQDEEIGKANNKWWEHMHRLTN